VRHDPVRAAEEYATADVISRGRLDIGFVKSGGSEMASGDANPMRIREREWEASHTLWIWPDRSPSMAFASAPARDSKLERALIVKFALAELLVAGGERVGIPGLLIPTSSRNVIDKMAQAMLHDDAARLSLPPSFVPSALAEIVVLSDFWSPITEIRTMLAGLSASGAHGTLPSGAMTKWPGSTRIPSGTR